MSDVGYSAFVTGVRERARAELTAEIVRLARVQMEEHGAASLSLRAIARELGMVSSAVYRYFPSRDELLTRLIIDSYDRLGEAVESADAAAKRRNDFPARFRAMTHAIRTWALDNPADYALLFGTPVPGYAAPTDTVGPASRYTFAMVQLVAEMEAAGHASRDKVPASLRRDYARFRARFSIAVSDSMLMKGMSAWANVMGAINLELFGHLHNVVDTPGALFEAVVELQGRQLFAGTASSRPTSNSA